MVYRTGDNNFGTAKWIVDAVAGQGTHTTIASALTSASSGDTILIRPGTYTENLSLKAGVNLCAFACDAYNTNVKIIGKLSYSSAGTVAISGICLQTNSDFLLSVTGSVASVVYLLGCNLQMTNNTGIQFTSSSASSIVSLYNCIGDTTTTGITIISDSAAGTTFIQYCDLYNSGNSTTQMTKSDGVISFRYTTCRTPINFTSAVASIGPTVSGINQTNINCSGTNSIFLTTSGTGTFSITGSNISTGSAAITTIGAGTTVRISSSVLNSSATDILTGAGTVYTGGNVCVGASSGNNVSVINNFTVI